MLLLAASFSFIPEVVWGFFPPFPSGDVEVVVATKILHTCTVHTQQYSSRERKKMEGNCEDALARNLFYSALKIPSLSKKCQLYQFRKAWV